LRLASSPYSLDDLLDPRTNQPPISADNDRYAIDKPSSVTLRFQQREPTILQ
jgi:hypothetical protein